MSKLQTLIVASSVMDCLDMQKKLQSQYSVCIWNQESALKREYRQIIIHPALTKLELERREANPGWLDLLLKQIRPDHNIPEGSRVIRV